MLIDSSILFISTLVTISSVLDQANITILYRQTYIHMVTCYAAFFQLTRLTPDNRK